MRLRRSGVQLLQSLRSEMRSGLRSMRPEMRSCSSGLWLRRPGVQILQSLRSLHSWKSLRKTELRFLWRESRLRSVLLRSRRCSDSCGCRRCSGRSRSRRSGDVRSGNLRSGNLRSVLQSLRSDSSLRS